VKVRFWGVRGSIATPGPTTVRYGGNTACVEVRSDAGTVLVLDCGTGAAQLGRALVAAGEVRGGLLIGHTHWDHIQGLPFFAPLFEPGGEWDVYGPRGLGGSLATTLAGQMQYQYFPVTLEQLGAQVRYHDLVEGSFQVGDLTITAQYLNHPAMTLGYRIEGDGVGVAYACDHEPFDPTLAHGGDLTASAPDLRHVEFLSGVDLLVHDAQYVAAEYQTRRGWGHSTVEYALEVARLAGVGELVLTHHDPLRDDDALDQIVGWAREQGFAGTVSAASEGDVRELRTSGPPRHVGTRESAVREPSPQDLASTVVLTARDPDVGEAVRAAAGAEGMPVEAAHESASPGGVVVGDHDQDTDVLERLRVLLDSGVRPSVLAVTRDHPVSRFSDVVTDWLVWPATVGHVRTKLRAAVLRRACRWQCAPLPADERERLEALRALSLLDTPPEERFDRWTREACRALDVPVALVTLVDADRQWFKSRQGIPLLETPRDESLCAHAILEEEMLLVPDLLADDRFADNPCTSPPYSIRFYAGVPLVLWDGRRVGTFCVADQRPRTLDAAQLATLRHLAEQVQREL
jgi:phosphoribosyl 1,2-cyclic phosphodiesterase